MTYFMKAIRNLEPLLIQFRQTGNVHAFVQGEFSSQQYLRLEKYHIVAHFFSTDDSIVRIGARITEANGARSPDPGG